MKSGESVFKQLLRQPRWAAEIEAAQRTRRAWLILPIEFIDYTRPIIYKLPHGSVKIKKRTFEICRNFPFLQANIGVDFVHCWVKNDIQPACIKEFTQG